jgi:uncharacterized protein YbjT (DUF2867 family)
MKIIIIGGTGLIGSKLVTQLRDHDVVAAAPNTGVDTITGEGVAEVLVGADVVVDVSNSPSFEDEAVLDFFRTSTTHLLAAEEAAGVSHHVALSVVGTEKLSSSGYMRAKVAQEELIRASGTPWSLVHATQFYEFLTAIAQAATVGAEVRVAPVAFQPMAADDVAAAIARVAVGRPLIGTQEIGGPERVQMDTFLREVLEQRGDARTVVTDPRATYFGTELTGDDLVPGPGAALGSTTYADWSIQQTVTA